jgi:hypothetical protein
MDKGAFRSTKITSFQMAIAQTKKPHSVRMYGNNNIIPVRLPNYTVQQLQRLDRALFVALETKLPERKKERRLGMIHNSGR